jgi:hypothetical protein
LGLVHNRGLVKSERHAIAPAKQPLREALTLDVHDASDPKKIIERQYPKAIWRREIMSWVGNARIVSRFFNILSFARYKKYGHSSLED